MSFQPRYDEQRKIYRDCKWCNGRGCLSCEAEADKAYKEQFPDGPQPILTVNPNDPKQMDALKRIIGAQSINKAFGPGGGEMTEIMESIDREKKSGNIPS